MFEPAESTVWQNLRGATGAHYSIFGVRNADNRGELGMAGLRAMFPEGEADDMNFVLFSTSGVHGDYTTIEEVEAGIQKYGDDPEFSEEDAPDDWNGNTITFLIVHPRIVCLRYGNAKVTTDDIPYLKKLRASSLAAVAGIGVPA